MLLEHPLRYRGWSRHSSSKFTSTSQKNEVLTEDIWDGVQSGIGETIFVRCLRDTTHVIAH